MTRLIVAHKPDRDRYRAWNCRAGIRKAAARGATALDVDVQVTRDVMLVATHWERPMLRDGFTDPEGTLSRFTRVDRMWLHEVMRLRSPEGYRIRPVHHLIPTAHRHGVRLCLEAKQDAILERREAWEQLDADVRGWGPFPGPVVVMSQPFGGAGVRVLRAAKDAGLPTLLLTRGRVRPEWWPALDYVKGPARWTEPGRPARVVVAGSRRLS